MKLLVGDCIKNIEFMKRKSCSHKDVSHNIHKFLDFNVKQVKNEIQM
jgi:hypothetical protein